MTVQNVTLACYFRPVQIPGLTHILTKLKLLQCETSLHYFTHDNNKTPVPFTLCTDDGFTSSRENQAVAFLNIGNRSLTLVTVGTETGSSTFWIQVHGKSHALFHSWWGRILLLRTQNHKSKKPTT